MNLFEQISVDLTTGKIAYPSLEGFTLDTEAVYRTCQLHMPFCNGSVEMAVRHAIHQQLLAHQGMAQTFAALRGRQGTAA
jgi:hypothetical protein